MPFPELSMPLRLYTVFHLNLAYSSIEEAQHMEVIRRCYWPLLRLCREYNLPLGIEASGYTLETVNSIDPEWLAELRQLCSGGPCEFVGSGYAQIIGPLVPAEVNAANLGIGQKVYERLLGFRPSIGLVNEQAYSAGLVRHYLDAGYRAIVMEWDNPARYHPEWRPEWRYLPQFACGLQDEQIPLIWNNSIVFQKFQHYAHGELDLAEYVEYLGGHGAETTRALPLYGNDVEVFDFRPGRFHTEAPLQDQGEWNRIGRLLETLSEDKRFQFVRPGQVLDLMREPGAGNRLRLESPEQPVPVKKQGKYNLTRWAVTGRDNLGINTSCWRIYEALKAKAEAEEKDWRELCFLWGSDFRTHITEKRWVDFRERLENFGRRVGAEDGTPEAASTGTRPRRGCAEPDRTQPSEATVSREGRYLTVETDSVRAHLNCRRGIAIDSLWFKEVSDHPLCGTLHHGYYDDIQFGADYYTGHLTMELPGRPKVTDLDSIAPSIETLCDRVVIRGSVETPLGPIHKQVSVFKGAARLGIGYVLDWEAIPIGSLRLGHITLNPEAFDRSTLFYRTHNGGYGKESFFLSDKSIDHGSAVSFLVSAAHGIGVTDGVVEIGDARRYLNVILDKAENALIGFIHYQKVGDTYFFRLSFSAGEMDETRKLNFREGNGFKCEISIELNRDSKPKKLDGSKLNLNTDRRGCCSL